MTQAQSYLRWKEEREVSTEYIAREGSAAPITEQSIEQLNVRQPFKYRKQLYAYKQQLNMNLA